MKRILPIFLSMVLAVPLLGCGEEEVFERPAPNVLTREAIGYFCGMIVADHPGPKGQIILRESQETRWFSSVRDTLAYTRLPEETDPIAAIYVSDMGQAESWAEPGGGNWISLEAAFFVIGSDQRGGMGAPEVVPFASRQEAEVFIAEHGGALATLDDIPDEALLGSWDDEDAGLPAEGQDDSY